VNPTITQLLAARRRSVRARGPALSGSRWVATNLFCITKSGSESPKPTTIIGRLPFFGAGPLRPPTRIKVRDGPTGGLKALPERNMDGAAGYPARSAPHESRSPPTANLRSGRFLRAQTRWVAAGGRGARGVPKPFAPLGLMEIKSWGAFPRPGLEESMGLWFFGVGSLFQSFGDGGQRFQWSIFQKRFVFPDPRIDPGSRLNLERWVVM